MQTIVIVTTDHHDPDDAMRSVSNAMKRAGYNEVDYSTEAHYVSKGEGYLKVSIVGGSDVHLLQVIEPEIDTRAVR